MNEIHILKDVNKSRKCHLLNEKVFLIRETKCTLGQPNFLGKTGNNSTGTFGQKVSAYQFLSNSKQRLTTLPKKVLRIWWKLVYTHLLVHGSPGVCPSFPKILGWLNARCNEMIIRYHGGAVEIWNRCIWQWTSLIIIHPPHFRDLIASSIRNILRRHTTISFGVLYNTKPAHSKPFQFPFTISEENLEHYNSSTKQLWNHFQGLYSPVHNCISSL